MNGSADFDFIIGSWHIQNSRRNGDGVWIEDHATETYEKHIGGRVVVGHYQGTTLAGHAMRGMPLLAFEPSTEDWSVLYFSDREAVDLTPMVGKFKDGVGLFHQTVTDEDGNQIRVRWIWDEIGPNNHRWQQAFCRDGSNWDTSWIQRLTRLNATD